MSYQPAGKSGLVIVGAGPAGVAAAIEAGRWGGSALLLDDRPTPGGQIFRQPAPSLPEGTPFAARPDHARGEALLARLHQSRATQVMNATVIDIHPGAPHVIRYVRDEQMACVEAEHVILATGAYDRPVPLPGWTLPGVLAAGGAQALAKGQGVLPGTCAVVAGTGPLILTFAAQLHSWGLNVAAVTEWASRPRLRDLAAVAFRGTLAPSYLRQGASCAAYLARHKIPFHFGTVPVRILGSTQVTGVELSRLDGQGRPDPASAFVVKADCVCLGFGLLPSLELVRLCGCDMSADTNSGTDLPVRSAFLETSVPGLFAVGDGVSVRGSAVAMNEGKIAGLVASQRLGLVPPAEFGKRARHLQARLERSVAFQHALAQLYPESISNTALATADTVICRCEDVTRRQIESASQASGQLADASTVKAMTRAGMGPCQARMCAESIYSLVTGSLVTGAADGPGPLLRRFTARPPARPVHLGAVMAEADFEGRDADIPEDPESQG